MRIEFGKEDVYKGVFDFFESEEIDYSDEIIECAMEFITHLVTEIHVRCYDFESLSDERKAALNMIKGIEALANRYYYDESNLFKTWLYGELNYSDSDEMLLDENGDDESE